jgi:Ca2+-dependent lipid-binding protein
MKVVQTVTNKYIISYIKVNIQNEHEYFQANDLQPRDFSGTADPYAKIRLLPDKTNFWQTKIHKRTLNPSK